MSKSKQNCGISWHGFWKRTDRYAAWIDVADSASKTANGYAISNKHMGFPIEDKNVNKLNRLFLWAYNRAKKLRPDWVKLYRGASLRRNDFRPSNPSEIGTY